MSKLSKFDREFKVGEQFPTEFDEWLIDKLIPEREFNLIGGPSGAGKSTLLFQMMYDFVDGKDVFGHKVHPVPCAYVSLDRSHVQALRTMLRIVQKEKPENRIVKFPWWGLGGTRNRPKTLKAVVDLVKTRQPDVKFLVIEGLANMLGNGQQNEYQATGEFLNDLSCLCHEQGMTVLASVHSPKQKEKDRYNNPRERVLGSVNWAGSADTVILIEPVSVESDTDSSRLIFLLPRDQAQEVPVYVFQDGRLVPDEQSAETPWRILMDLELFKLPVGAQFNSAQVSEWAEGHKVPVRSRDRWKEEKIEEKVMSRVQKGVYEVLPRQAAARPN